MLRTGMEMMSAILGGADIIANLPFDAVFKKSNEFSERIARNQLIILKNEANFEEALNSTNGNYFIEENTEKLAEKALDIFKNIEKSGGFLDQLYKGKIQKKIKEAADKEQAEFDNQKRVLVGTNKYINTKESPPEIDFYPFMKKRKGQTLIQPVIPKRLAEKTEQQRLQQMEITF
jgi:methylmalonyl-CoA mutase